ncbi:flagellar hook-associated protein FlgK [Paradesulfitobacterium aromaticivorans]
MHSTFFGLELARRALETQQYALDVTGHNIANANTQGYTRQVANMKSTTPDTINSLGHSLSVGTGVTLENITRARDAFVDRQYRWETTKQEYWGGRQDALQKVEGMFNEPSENSLHDDMNKFWTAWSDLSKNPENMGARSVVHERALTLIDSFHHLAQQVTDMKNNMDANVRVQIHQINSYSEQIADLNEQIKRAEVAGDNPNDLRDKRDSLVDDLSKIVSVRVVETIDSNFTDREVHNYQVNIGAETTPPQILVSNTTAYKLDETAVNGNGFAVVQWDASAPNPGAALNLGDRLGSLQANMEIRDDYLPNFLQKFLDDLALGIAQTVNTLHNTGEGLTAGVQGDFFDPASTTAANIALDPYVDDLSHIATRPIGAEIGDGGVAQQISSLANGWAAAPSPFPTSAATSFGDFYGANIAQMGIDVQQADRMKAGEDVLVTHLSNQRESLSGVSLDEEMTNLVRFQKSYSAAARVVTMMDDMLDTIVNRMGVTR